MEVTRNTYIQYKTNPNKQGWRETEVDTLVIIVPPALARKTSHGHIVLSVVRTGNIRFYLPHALMDFNQSWS